MESDSRGVKMIREGNMDLYDRKIFTLDYQRLKIELTNKDTGMKYIAYGFNINRNNFQGIRRTLEQEMKQYFTVDKQFASIEDAFLTEIGLKAKKKLYVMFVRKFRQTSITLADLAAAPQKKAQINILKIAIKLATAMSSLEELSLTHSNLSAQTVEYCNNNLIIDLPVLPAIWSELTKNQKSNDKSSPSQNNNSDIRGYLEILVKLSVDQQFQKKVTLDIWGPQTAALIKSITKKTRIKQFLEQVIVEKKIQEQKLTFRAICSFLESGQFSPQKQHFSVMRETNREDIFDDVDVLHLPIIAPNQLKTESAISSLEDNSLHNMEVELGSFHLDIIEYENSLIFDLTSKLNTSIRSTVVLSIQQSIYPFKKYFESISQFTETVFKNKLGTLSLDDSGILSYRVPHQLALELQTQLRLKNSKKCIENNNFPENCTGFIRDGKTYTGRGFLLNESTFITTASSFYDRRRKKRRRNLVFSVAVCRGDCKQYRYPPQYQTCSEDQAWKYNYAMGRLDIEIKKSYYPDLIHDFDEKELWRRIKQNEGLQMFYRINSTELPWTDLQLRDDKLEGLSSSDEYGSPIYVSVGNRRAVIGMKNSKKQGISFKEEHIDKFYKWMNELQIDKHKICYSQMYNTSHFNFIEFEPLTYSLALINFKKQHDNSDIKILINQLLRDHQYEQLIATLEGLAMEPHLNSDRRINYYEVILQLYQDIYASKHWKTPYLLIEFAIALRQRKQYDQAIKCLSDAIQFEEKEGRNNAVLLGQLYFDLGNAHHSTKHFDEAEDCYSMAIMYFDKVHNFDEKAKCYQNLASIFNLTNKPKQVSQADQKAEEIKEEHSEEDDYIATEEEYIKYLATNNKIEQSIKTAEEVAQIAQNSSESRDHTNIKLEKIVKDIGKGIESTGIPKTLRQTYKDLSKKFGF